MVQSEIILVNRMDEETKNQIEQIKELAGEILDERSVPKNMRIKINEALKKVFSKEKLEGVDLSNTMHILNEASGDPNTPVYIKTTLWELISALEEIKEKLK